MSGSWQNKDIDDWTCNELQQWIRHKRIGFTNEKILIDAIREQGITGEDFNSIREANDIKDQFPGVSTLIANKVYLALLKINNASDDNNITNNYTNNNGNNDNDSDNDSQTHSTQYRNKRRTLNENLQNDNDNIYTDNPTPDISIADVQPVEQKVEQKEGYSGAVRNQEHKNNNENIQIDSLSARGHRMNKRAARHWKPNNNNNVSDSDDNKHNNLQADKVKQRYEQRITKLKKEYENKMRRQERKTDKQLAKFQNDIDEWTDKYNVLKKSTQVLKEQNNKFTKQLNDEQHYLDRIHDLTAKKIELSDSNKAYKQRQNVLNNKITQQKQRYENKEKQLREQLEILKTEKKKYKRQINEKEENMKHTESNKTKQMNEIAQLKQQQKEMQVKYKRILKRYNEFENTKHETLEELKQVKKKLRGEKNELFLENVRIKEQYDKLIKEKEKQLEKQANDMAKMNEKQHETQANYSQLLVRNETYEIARDKACNDLKQLTKKYDTEMDQYKINIKRLQDNIKKVENETREINDKYVMMGKSKNELLTENKRIKNKMEKIKNERNKTEKKINEMEKNDKITSQEIETVQKEKKKLLKRLQNVEKQMIECKQTIKTLKATNQSQTEQSNMNTKPQKDLEIEYNELLKQHSECADEIVKLQKWKTKCKNKNKQLWALRKEKIIIELQNNELNDKIKQLDNKLNEYESEYDSNQQYNQPNMDIQIMSAPCDIMDDSDTDDAMDEKEEKDNFMVSDDELCKLLQEDLENYMIDQTKNQRHREKRQENVSKQQKKKKKNSLVLNEVKIFHENKSQILRNWNVSLKKNHFATLFETLEEKLEDKYEENDEIDSERLAYNILFDCVIECYDILHTKHIKIIHNEYMSPNVINIVQMNICTFYDLMNKQKLKTLKKRMANINTYIRNIIDAIYKKIQKKYINDVNDENKDELCGFIVNCCQLIWSVLHYDFTIYPVNFLLNKSDTKYNDKIHEKEGAYRGDNIIMCVFPALMKHNEYQTKIWVVCDEE